MSTSIVARRATPFTLSCCIVSPLPVPVHALTGKTSGYSCPGTTLGREWTGWSYAVAEETSSVCLAVSPARLLTLSD